MNNRILENDEDIANAMNNHFSQIGATLAAKFPNNGDHQRYMKKKSLHPSSWSQWTMKKQLRRLQN